jgi:hypothetical protein
MRIYIILIDEKKLILKRFSELCCNCNNKKEWKTVEALLGNNPLMSN